MDRPTSQPKDISATRSREVASPSHQVSFRSREAVQPYTLAGVNAVKEKERDWGLNRALSGSVHHKKSHESEVSRLLTPSVPSVGIEREPSSPVYPRETGR